MTFIEFSDADADTQRRILNDSFLRTYCTEYNATEKRILTGSDRMTLFSDYYHGLATAYESGVTAAGIIERRLADKADKAAAAAAAPAPAVTAPVAVSGDSDSKLQLLQEILGGSVNRGEVEAICRDMIAESDKPQRVELVIPTLPPVSTAGKHYQFRKILQLAAMRRNSLLVGEAGSGKTTAAVQVAAALELEFYTISCCAQTAKSDFFGYKSITTGEFIGTDFYTAYIDGGVFLLDEIDSCNPAVLLAINAAIENGFCSFANGRKTQHADFICIAAGNTYGLGADKNYTGRGRLDRSTLDRFAKIAFGYDTDMEQAAALAINADCLAWIEKVQGIRSRAAELKIDILVSPRTTYTGAELLLAGWSESEILDATCFAGLGADTIKRLAA